MNLDDLLKSIRDEDDDDSKGGKDLDDLLESIRSEEKSSTINSAKFFDNDEYDDYYKELVDEGSIDDLNLSEEERQKGIAAFRSNKLDFKKFVTDIQSLKPEVEQLNQEPLTIREQFFTAPKIEPSKLIPEDESENEEIIEKLNELIAVINADNALEKERQDYEEKIDAEGKRKKREKRIESGKIFGITKTADKVIKKSQSIFDSIIKFLTFTVLGQIVKFVTDFLENPQNKEFIENIQNFVRSIPGRLKEAREKIQGIIDWFTNTVNEVKKFTADFRELLKKAPFLGDLFKTQEEKDLEREVEEKRREGQKKTGGTLLQTEPFGGLFGGSFIDDNMISFTTDFIPELIGESFNIITGTQPANAGTIPQNLLLPGSRSSGFYISPEERRMLDAISGAEGTKGYGTLYGGRNIPELAMGKMTINQVLNMQETGMYKGQSVYEKDEYNSTATGRYQFMPVVLREEAERAGLDLNTTKFTPELQDELILRRIRRMRGVTPEMLKSEGMSDQVIDRLAPEFASFPNLFGPDNEGRDIQGTSFYGQGGKSADFIKDLYNKSSGMKMSPTPPPVLPPPGLPSGTEKPVDDRFDGFDLDFIFKPIRQLFGVDTPYAPTSTKMIVLPPIKQQAKQPTTTQTSNEIPDFRVSSGIEIRRSIGDALGIGDLVS